jgi:hypothetical protein
MRYSCGLLACRYLKSEGLHLVVKANSHQIELPELRPPAVPLIACDPYFSVWSFADRLTDEHTKHWTGAVQSMACLMRIDGTAYRLMGPEPRDTPVLRQISLEVLPTRTIYRFTDAGVQVTLTFTTPSLPHDLDKLSWPVTYITWDIIATDQKEHTASLYFDVSGTLTTNTHDEKVVWGRLRLDDQDVLYIGSQEQNVLKKAGDNLRIDWGYLYAHAGSSTESTFGPTRNARRSFASDGSIFADDPFEMPDFARRAGTIFRFPTSTVGSHAVSYTMILAYDDQYSIEYLGRKLRPYWRRNGWTAADLLRAAQAEQDAVMGQCAALDAELMNDMTDLAGAKYARLCALSFRQCIAAHKLAADFDGTPLFFSKENFSNGCIATVDVTYPAAPFYLLFNPELLKGTMRPILEYASLPRWRFPFAPHDIGTYPLANGQVYGGGEVSEENQMPVEECGNMLILCAALATYENNIDFIKPYRSIIRQWAQYLKDKGFDPDNQLCTDDFGGHLAHNTNLSIKAILGLASYARLCAIWGETDEAEEYRGVAEAYASEWQQQAQDGDHYRLTFDGPGTWSQKYNLVWDQLLGLKVFDPQIARTEIAYYKTMQNEFGLPLDNRHKWTKLDWIIWSATLAEDDADFNAFVEPVYEFVHRSPSRVPLTDWYFTDNGRQRGFQARSVVGGVFIKALANKALWQKWAEKACK